MKNKTEYINSLATKFILSADAVEKVNLLNEAKRYMKAASGKSPAQTLKHIAISYFGAVNSSQKMEKGKKLNYDSYVIYLSPSDSSGVQFCSDASTGCILACLSQSGHALIAMRAKGVANTITVSRLKKSWLMAFNREQAERVICHEISLKSKSAEKRGAKFAARLNGTSDLFFGSVFKKLPEITFYDYTKHSQFLKLSESFENWNVTFSFSGENETAVIDAIKNGFNVAFPVVGKDSVKRLIAEKKGIDFDSTDLRFLDPVSGFGILSVKETGKTREGIEKGFLLSESGYLDFQNKVISALS